MDILQEILRQQQILRIQQNAVQNLQVPIPAAAAAAAPAPAPQINDADPDVDVDGPLPDIGLLPAHPPMPLNALQGWQLQWQQQQQQHLRHLQPFLADPLPAAVPGAPRPARPGFLAPPGAVQA